MSGKNGHLYEFGEFRFDGTTHRLWQNSELIFLSPKASKLLQLLLEKDGEYVSKEEIFETVWADTFVEDGVLTQNIYTLRKALGKNRDDQPLIENRTKLGYRITVPVTISQNETNGNHHSIESVIFDNDLDAPVKKRTLKKFGAVLFLGLILLATTGFFGYRSFRPRIASFFRKPVEGVQFHSLTNSGNTNFPILSRDGNFAAYVLENHVLLKDIVSDKEIRLDIPNILTFSSLQFSPDGNFIYFRPTDSFRKDASIRQVSRFGGETRLVAEKTWGSFGVSNKGTEIAFIRNLAEQTKQVLIVKNLETGDEREITRIDFPDMFLHTCAPAWSPDDKRIAFVVQNMTARRTALFLIDTASGQKEEIKIQRLRQYEQIAWMPDGESLVASASEGGKFFHLWKLFYRDGDAQRITNGLNTFGRISISADGKKILAQQTAENSNIFIANAANVADQKQVTFGNTNNVGQTALEWADENKLVYVSYSEENPMANLWSVNIADNSRQPLTANTDFNCDSPTVSADARSIYFTTSQSPFVNAWRMDASGGNLTQITNGKDGWRLNTQASQDGKYLYYIFRDREGGAIKRFNLAENMEETVLEKGAANPVASLSLSADGTRLMFLNWSNNIGGDDDKINFQFGMISTVNPADIRLFDLKLLNVSVHITADGKAFDYPSYDEKGTMIMRQNIDGGEPTVILALPKERIFNFAWSKNGDRLAISRGRQNRDAVLLTNFE